jgi:hypothetical protein
MATYHSKVQLINETTSPLHRIMWVYNADDTQKRVFENNICAFHIGNGYLLSVAHNLRTQAGCFKSIDEEIFKSDLLYKLDGSQKLLFEQHYFHDSYTKKLYLNKAEPAALQGIANILKLKRFDTRWVTMAEKGICTPYLVVQFREDSFYGDREVFNSMPPYQRIHEPEINKYTYLLQVELVQPFYGADIALYRIVNTPQEIINKLPAVDVSTEMLEETPSEFCCLQSSPNSPVGRLLNTAVMEGIMDHFGFFPDDIGGNYTFEGFRYLVKGYFRFGSSGAPYLMYDALHGRYVANAIQSEASGIQLSIKNDKEGNFQYINAIASPLHLIKDELMRYL